MRQAQDYVESIIECGLLNGAPRVQAYVIGHKVDKLGREPRQYSSSGFIASATYSQLVDTAHRKLFRLRELLEERYEGKTGHELLDRIMGEGKQMSFLDGEFSNEVE